MLGAFSMLKSIWVSLGMCVLSLILIAILAKSCDEFCFPLAIVRIGIVVIYVIVGYIGGRFVKWACICPHFLCLIFYLGEIYLLGYLVDGHEGDTLGKICISYVIIATSYGLAFVK